MAKQKQESMAGWQEQAKAYAKAERELRIERYFRVELRKQKSQELLYSYDLPIELFSVNTGLLSGAEPSWCASTQGRR